MALRTTNCHIIDKKRRKFLLKMAARGVSKGKWNALGGRIEGRETPHQNAVREVFEESCLKIKNLFYHGVLKFHLHGSKKTAIEMHLFSTTNFSGKLRATEEGRLSWFDLDKIPYEKMWNDDIYWMNLMLHRKRFNGDFFFDRNNKKVIKSIIVMKPQ